MRCPLVTLSENLRTRRADRPRWRDQRCWEHQAPTQRPISARPAGLTQRGVTDPVIEAIAGTRHVYACVR